MMSKAILKREIEQLLKRLPKDRQEYWLAYKKLFDPPYSTILGRESISAELLQGLLKQGFLDASSQMGNGTFSDLIKQISNPEEIVFALLPRYTVKDLQDCRFKFLVVIMKKVLSER